MKSRRVGVIVPQGSEFGFIRESLPLRGSEVIDGQRYHQFQIPAAGVTGIVRVLSDMGQAPSTLAAERIFARLDVSLVVLVGTAASLDSAVRLGDVVVADQIQEYLRKTGVAPGAEAGSVVFERAAESWRTNARLVDHVNNFGWLPDGEPAIAAWRQAAAARFPGGTGGTAGDGGPAIHVGPVATGDLRVAARAFADWIKAANRKLIALEMEAAGAALAAYHNDSADLLVVRGVSDYADERKRDLDAGQGASGVEDAWRRYAVRNAVEYLVRLKARQGDPKALRALHVTDPTAQRKRIYGDNGFYAQDVAFNAFTAQHSGSLLVEEWPWLLRFLLISIDLIPLTTKLLNRYTIYGRRLSERALLIRYSDLQRDQETLHDIEHDSEVTRMYRTHDLDMREKHVVHDKYWQAVHVERDR